MAERHGERTLRPCEIITWTGLLMLVGGLSVMVVGLLMPDGRYREEEGLKGDFYRENELD